MKRPVKRKRRPIDPEVLTRMWEESYRIVDIAAHFKVTQHAIRTHVMRLQLPARRAPASKDHRSHMRRPGSEQRRCLCCGRTFFSEWIGNRICPPCKGTVEFRNGALA